MTFRQKTIKARDKGVTVINCGVGPEDDQTLELFIPKDHRTAGNASFLRTLERMI